MILFGHRGAAGEAPENTLAGFHHALQLGIRHFEIDLRLSLDEQLVLLHDSSLLRTTGVDRNVHDTHSEKLASLTAYGRRGETTTGIPTLQAVLDECPQIEMLQLELKSDATTDKPALVKALSSFIALNRCEQRCVATSFDSGLLAQVAAAIPTLPTGLVSDADPVASLDTATKLGCGYLCLNHALLENPGESLLAKLSGASQHISLWTVNKPAQLEKLNNLPIDSIITDFPSVMIAEQARHAAAGKPG